MFPKPPKTEPKRCPGPDFVALRNYVFYFGFGFVLKVLGVPVTNKTPTKTRGGYGTLTKHVFGRNCCRKRCPEGSRGGQMAPQGLPGGTQKSLKISLWGRLVPICDFRGSRGAAGTPNRGVLDGFLRSSVMSLGGCLRRPGFCRQSPRTPKT